MPNSIQPESKGSIGDWVMNKLGSNRSGAEAVATQPAVVSQEVSAGNGPGEAREQSFDVPKAAETSVPDFPQTSSEEGSVIPIKTPNSSDTFVPDFKPAETVEPTPVQAETTPEAAMPPADTTTDIAYDWKGPDVAAPDTSVEAEAPVNTFTSEPSPDLSATEVPAEEVPEAPTTFAEAPQTEVAPPESAEPSEPASSPEKPNPFLDNQAEVEEPESPKTFSIDDYTPEGDPIQPATTAEETAPAAEAEVGPAEPATSKEDHSEVAAEAEPEIEAVKPVVTMEAPEAVEDEVEITLPKHEGLNLSTEPEGDAEIESKPDSIMKDTLDIISPEPIVEEMPEAIKDISDIELDNELRQMTESVEALTAALDFLSERQEAVDRETKAEKAEVRADSESRIAEITAEEEEKIREIDSRKAAFDKAVRGRVDEIQAKLSEMLGLLGPAAAGVAKMRKGRVTSLPPMKSRRRIHS